jgi:2-octaprenyl-6-methoxyphenol hydroxylase
VEKVLMTNTTAVAGAGTPDMVDLVIVGAGMAGASLVHLLAPAMRDGLKVVLLDRQQIRADADVMQRPPSFDGRATALSWGTRQLLEQMGCWDAMSSRVCAIEHIQVSDRGRFGQTHLHASEQQTDALGYIVENTVLGQALLQGLQRRQGSSETLPGLTLRENSAVEQVMMTVDGCRLTLDDQSHLDCRLLVLADGARSGIASRLGITHDRQDYGSVALVTQVMTDRPHDHWAYERFSDHGPVAFLPLQERSFAVVWTLAADEIDAAMAQSDAELIRRLQALIGHRVGTITALGTRQTYPLALLKSREQVRRSLVLLGNAAHSLHPVAGQGFNLALRDTAVLAEYLLAAWHKGQNPGDLAMLQAYARRQQQDQRNTIAASDWLPRIFSHPGWLMALVRDTGLMTLAAAPTARRLLARHAMGLGHSAARLGYRERF